MVLSMRIEAAALISHSAFPMATRLLIVDDDDELTGLLGELLGQEGFEIETDRGGADATARAVSGA